MTKVKLNINVLGESLGKIADSVTAIAQGLTKYLSDSERRRMVKCIKNADNLIDRIQELRISDGEILKLIKKHKKYNN